jgi:hypothetical protein
VRSTAMAAEENPKRGLARGEKKWSHAVACEGLGQLEGACSSLKWPRACVRQRHGAALAQHKEAAM